MIEDLLDKKGFYRHAKKYSYYYMSPEESNLCFDVTRAIEELNKPCKFSGPEKNACNSYHASNKLLKNVNRITNGYKPNFSAENFQEEVVDSLVEGLNNYSKNSDTFIRYTREFFSSLEKHSKEFLGDKIKIKKVISDYVGYESLVEQFERRIIPSLKSNERMKKLGISGVKCALLHGPPGNGKTSLARHLSNKHEINLAAYNGAYFMNKYVGEGGRLIRKAYDSAMNSAPSILFVDEAETTIKDRNGDKTTYITSQWLSSIEGFNQSDNVTVLFAVNNIEVVDKAIISRCKENIFYVGNPTELDRRKIISNNFNRINSKVTSIEKLVEITENSSTRQLVSILEQIKWNAYNDGRDYVSDSDLCVIYQK